MTTRISRSEVRRYSSAGTALGALVLVAGIGGFAFSLGRGQPPMEQSVSRVFVPEFNVIEVPVPEKPVPAGTLVREIVFRPEKYPEHQLPRGVIREPSKDLDAMTLVALPAGLPILEENIGSADEATNPILGHIPPGMRAMTLRVDATTAVEGWVRSGSFVDVLLVEKSKTSVVAEKVKVISAERSLSPIEASGSSTIPSTVTLLVTQEQCLALNTAIPLGRISFALRSNRDGEGWRDTYFSSDDLAPPGDEQGAQKVEGVVSVGEGTSRKQFALVGGAWLPAESVPEGFLLHNRSQ